MPRINLNSKQAVKRAKKREGDTLDANKLYRLQQIEQHLGGVRPAAFQKALWRSQRPDATPEHHRIVDEMRRNGGANMVPFKDLGADPDWWQIERILNTNKTSARKNTKIKPNEHITAGHLDKIISAMTDESRYAGFSGRLTRAVSQHPRLTDDQKDRMFNSRISKSAEFLQELLKDKKLPPERISQIIKKLPDADYGAQSAQTYNSILKHKSFNDSHIGDLMEHVGPMYGRHIITQLGDKINGDHLKTYINATEKHINESGGHPYEALDGLYRHKAWTNEHSDRVLNSNNTNMAAHALNHDLENDRLLTSDKLKKLTELHPSLTNKALTHPNADPSMVKSAFDSIIAKHNEDPDNPYAKYNISDIIAHDSLPLDYTLPKVIEAGPNAMGDNWDTMMKRSDFTPEHAKQLIDYDKKHNDNDDGYYGGRQITRSLIERDAHKYKSHQEYNDPNTADYRRQELEQGRHNNPPVPLFDAETINHLALNAPQKKLQQAASKHHLLSPESAIRILETPNHPGISNALGHKSMPINNILDWAENQDTIDYNKSDKIKERLNSANDIDSDHLERIINSPKLSRHFSDVVRDNADRLTPNHIHGLWNSTDFNNKVVALSSRHATPQMFGEALRMPQHNMIQHTGGTNNRGWAYQNRISNLNNARVQMRRTAHHKIVNNMDVINPDDLHKRQVGIRFDTNKLRALRDQLDEKYAGQAPKRELEKAGLWNNNYGKLLDGKGQLSSSKLNEHINSLPESKYNLSFSTYHGAQHHNTKGSKVLQLNLTQEHIDKMKEAGVWEDFKKLNAERNGGGHPTAPHTLGWARWTGSPKTGVFVDELQSDLWRSKVQREFDSHIKEYRDGSQIEGYPKNYSDYEKEHEEELKNDPQYQAMSSDPGAQDSRDAYVAKKRQAMDNKVTKEVKNHFMSKPENAEAEAKHKKMMDIVFNGRHPGEVLMEGLHQYLRDKGHTNIPIATHSVETKYPISLGRRYPTADEIASDPSKAAPAHMKQSYEQIPQKVFGMKEGKYGTTPGKATKEERRVQPHEVEITSIMNGGDAPHKFISGRGKQSNNPQRPNIEPDKKIHEGIVRKMEEKLARIRDQIKKLKGE